ncbi:hypothetical protein IWQ56_006670, partial [Coemansia nantahalensis]
MAADSPVPAAAAREARAPFSVPSVAKPTLLYECGGAREFSSYVLYALVLAVPYLIKRALGLSLGAYFVVGA